MDGDDGEKMAYEKVPKHPTRRPVYAICPTLDVAFLDAENEDSTRSN